jgi:hypothetical protein
VIEKPIPIFSDTHTLLNFLLVVFKAWEMTLERHFPEVKSTIWDIVKANHAKLIARRHSTPQEF